MQRSQRDRELVGERKFAEVSQELSATASSLLMAEVDLKTRSSQCDALQLDLVNTRALIGTSDASSQIQNALVVD